MPEDNTPSSSRSRYWVFYAAGIVALVLIYWFVIRVPTTTFATDQTFTESYTIPEGTRIVVSNDAKLTFEQDLIIRGELVCADGALSFSVKAHMILSGKLGCNRDENLPEGDLGLGIVVQANSFESSDDAVIYSNSHIQILSNDVKVASTQAELDQIYEEAGTYRGEKWHMGPFTPTEQIPAGTPGLPEASAGSHISWNMDHVTSLPTGQAGSNFSIPFINKAQAADPPITRIGGTWVVGTGGPPPLSLSVPTPPKGINKIILNFNFGNNPMEISNFELSGPDGRAGADDGGGCNVKGKNGEDAMRLNVRAGSIVVNNFTLRLGAGGKGGDATTDRNCDPGTAQGGKGGSGGNFKMVAENSFDIKGAFDIYPGKGGQGGEANAYGKVGEDGCAGKKGGDATGTGGAGGDNKKVLTVTGTINGLSNVTIFEMVGGAGGAGVAESGNGGNGTGPGCAGGPGGNATATGGKGGDTACNKFPCTGGDGGNSNAVAGAGGKGGQGTETLPGGNGGKGGDAVSNPGKGGVGKTANGVDGTKEAENGGNGGNGGDGCDEGNGGNGGAGNPPGVDGSDGKNLCKPSTGVPAPDATTIPIEIISLTLTSSNLTFVHNIGQTQCPQVIGTSQVNGSGASKWKIYSPLPGWLNLTTQGNVGGSIQAVFNCQLQQYVSQSLNADVKVQLVNDAGQPVGNHAIIRVTGQINAEH